jgi:predicted DNA-binding protein with PD1-like motif
MKVYEGKVDRVFGLRMEKGDHLIADLTRLAEERQIRTGLILLLGAVDGSQMVLGVQGWNAGMPDFERLASNDHRELIGVGSITAKDGRPKVHLHVATGLHQEAFIAHVEEAVISGMEVFIIECLGADLPSSSLL